MVYNSSVWFILCHQYIITLACSINIRIWSFISFAYLYEIMVRQMLVEVNGHLESTGSNCESRVNTISQAGILEPITYLVCRCTVSSTRSLLLLVEVKSHLGTTEVKLWKPCIHDISINIYHIRYVGVPRSVLEVYCLWWRSRVSVFCILV